jgi:FkbM family methyltransferase
MIRDLVRLYRKLPVKPFKSGLGNLLRNYQVRNKDKLVLSRIDGITFELDLRELIDSSLYFEGCFEPKTTELITAYVKRGMVVLDIGANIGCHALRCAQLAGSGGKVIAFEPMSAAFRKLQRNVSLNRFANIILEKSALADREKPNVEVSFQSSWKVDHIADEAGGSEQINVTTIDSYLERNGIAAIDLIKLDVDGYEYKIIAGGLRTIRNSMPVLIMEFGKYTLERCGDSLEQLIDLLHSLGYAIYSERDTSVRRSKDELLGEVPEDGTINVLCRPPR